MEVIGRDFNFYLKRYNKLDLDLIKSNEFFDEFLSEYEDRRVSCMLYENSSIYHDDNNDLNYGSTLTKEEVEIGAIYLIKYYFYESSNYTIDINNFKKGSVEGFPLIMNLMNINDSAFFGTPITSIKANGKLHYLELEDSSDQSEIHYALFAGNDLNKAELIMNVSENKKNYKNLIKSKLQKFLEIK